jgi:hypothetical protein
MPVVSGGAVKQSPSAPVAEHARSALGRERVFGYFSGTLMALFRLDVAVKLRYGVVQDVAQKVRAGESVSLALRWVKLICPRDARAWALRSLLLAQSPPLALNVPGAERGSVRWLARRLGNLLGKEPRFGAEEAETALLSDATTAHGPFGLPTVALNTVVQWGAHWVTEELPTRIRPTHFSGRC